jgi:tRNA1(Val) A37 N6-methylase TrmN6
MISGEVDAVFANPPYMTVSSGKANISDAKYIARHEVLGTVADFAAAAARVLKFGGSYYVVWRPDRLPALLTALTNAGLTPKRMTAVHGDAKSSPSLILIEAKKGGAIDGFFLTKPLLLHEDTKATPLMDTPDCKLIYEIGEFPNEYIRP